VSGARALLVLHAVLALALVGSATHLMLQAVKLLLGRRPPARLLRTYALTAGPLCLATVGVGLVLYPAYKVRVFAAWMQEHAPGVAELFELKEVAGLFTLPFALALFVLGRRLDKDDAEVGRAFAIFALTLFVLCAFAALSGLVVVAERGL
jgi:hypothetical protein